MPLLTTNEFLAKHNILSLPHPPYSPDLAPCDFFLFPQLKKTMKGRRFDDVEEIQAQGHYFEGDKPKQPLSLVFH